VNTKQIILFFTLSILLMPLLSPLYIYGEDVEPMTPVSEVVPFDSYHIIPVNNILYPRLLAPIFAVSGDIKTIYIYPASTDNALDGWSVSLLNKITGEVYSLEVINVRWVTDDREENVVNKYVAIDVKVPQGIKRALYNLVLERASRYEEPNSFYVFGDTYPDSITVAHISDNHIGPGQKSKYMKENKFFSRALATLEALGVDLIISTGDFVDGIRDEDFHIFVYNWLSTLSVPFIVCTGNTDYSVMEGNQWHWEKYLAPNSAGIRINNILILSINARNGDLPDSTITWIEDVLRKNIDANIKVYIQHYPSFDPNSTSEKVINKLAEWAENYGLNLALHGHFHNDIIKTPPETPFTTIVSTSTATTNLYRGFRILTLYEDGSIEYEENSRNLYETYVEYLQPNTYTSTGQTAIVKYRNMPLTLIIKLKDIGKEAIVEGAEKTAEYVFNGLRTVYISVTPVEEEVTIKVYQEQDTIPPSIRAIVTATVNEIEIRPIVTDEGLGVAEIKVYYSPDNESWTEFTPEIEDEVLIFVMKTPQYNIYYYKIVARDIAGKESSYYGYVELGLGPEEKPVQPSIQLEYLAIIILLLVVIVGYVIWRVKR